MSKLKGTDPSITRILFYRMFHTASAKSGEISDAGPRAMVSSKTALMKVYFSA